jgi:predicted permease
MVLLVGATLLTRTLYHLSTVDPGFESDGIVLATVNPAARAYKDERLSTYYGELLARVRAVGGVQAATLLQFNLLTSSRTTGTLGAPGFTPASEDERWVQVFQVGPQFFTTLGMRLAEGRDFEDEDLDGPPVAALNQTAAQRYFGSQSAIGRTVRQDTTGTEFRIIAVVRDATYNTLRDVPAAAVFVPYPTARRGSMTFAVRVSDELSGAQALALAIRSLDSAVPFETTTLRTLVERSLSQERLLATMATVFAAAALLLLTVGLYGVMAFRVTRRTAEIGVRVALGAQRSHVIWSVLRTPLTLVAIGVGLGSLATFAGGRFIANLLFGLAPQDAVTILAAALVLIAVTVLAGIVPAQRASRVDPLVALRCD